MPPRTIELAYAGIKGAVLSPGDAERGKRDGWSGAEQSRKALGPNNVSDDGEQRD
jgi:hypothetical protein